MDKLQKNNMLKQPNLINTIRKKTLNKDQCVKITTKEKESTQNRVQIVKHLNRSITLRDISDQIWGTVTVWCFRVRRETGVHSFAVKSHRF